MAYCVHCGVRLDPSEKYCPLCGVPVLDPLQPYQADAKKSYADRHDPVIVRKNRRLTAGMISIILIFPALLCLAIDFSVSRQIDWSLYPTGALVVLWTGLVPPFLWVRPSFLRIFLPFALTGLAYVYLISYLQLNGDWFLPLALPVYLLTAILTGVITIVFQRRKLSLFYLPAFIMISAGLLSLAIDLLIRSYLEQALRPGWSLFVMLPCIAVALVLVLLARRHALREAVARRLHV